MTAANKNKSLNFILFILYQMSYNLLEVGAFAPSSHLRACIRLANPAMNVPKAIRSLIINSIRFFCFFFFLLILFSPPEYNITYGAPYVNIYFKKMKKMQDDTIWMSSLFTDTILPHPKRKKRKNFYFFQVDATNRRNTTSGSFMAI